VLLTGANIAHLQLARAFARRREIRTRLAVGAARARVVRQLVTEAGLLCLLGGAAGLVFLYMSLPFLMRVSEMELPAVWQPDVAVFGYCLAVSLLMSVTFSLLPALRTTRTSLLPGGHAITTHPPMRFSLALLATQIALAAALLTCGSLLTRAVTHATSGDVGFEIDDVVVASVVRGPGADRAGDATFGRAVRSALQVSLMQPVAYADVTPLSYSLSTSIRRAGDGADAARSADIAPVSPNIFTVLGIPLVAGRTLNDRPEVGEALVNERLAALLFPNGDAVGQRVIEQAQTFVVGGPRTEISGQQAPAGDQSYVIVGVTRDVYFTRRDDIRPTLYVPNSRALPTAIFRASDTADVSRLKAAITGLDPQATILVRPLRHVIASRLGDSRFAARGAWAGGLLALALATFGVFGVFAFAVEQRRREIGIRVALGATGRDVLGAMFRAARLAVLSGLAAGLVLSLIAGPAMQPALLGLPPFDPIAFGVVALLLAAAGVAATAIPARRALSIDPAVILKDDA
jgi:predicted permease